MSSQLRYASLVALFCALITTCGAEDPREQAWSVLDQGLTNSSLEKRTKAVGDLGLLPATPRPSKPA